MSAKVNELIGRLEESPIYAMSLGNHELFHSNFWAWLFKNTSQGSEYVKVFFDTFDSNSEFTVEREQENRDLTIWQNRRAFVIENKLKSIPSVEQLQKYTSKLKDKCEEAVFTGMVNPFSENNKGPCFSSEESNKYWGFKGYLDIGKEIKRIAQNETCYKTRQLISDYAQMICDANDLLNEIITSIGKDNLIIRPAETNGEKTRLEKIKLQDIVLKMNAALLLSNEIPINGLSRELSFNHKKATMTFRLKNKDASHSAGIQIEGNQYRRFLECEKKDQCDDIYILTKSAQWFDEKFDDKNREVFGKKTSMSPDNGKYNVYEKPHSFVYQYWDLNKTYTHTVNTGEFFTTVDFSEVQKQILEDLKLAEKLDWLK